MKYIIVETRFIIIGKATQDFCRQQVIELIAAVESKAVATVDVAEIILETYTDNTAAEKPAFGLYRKNQTEI